MIVMQTASLPEGHPGYTPGPTHAHENQSPSVNTGPVTYWVSWPPADLSLNSRKHWSARAGAAKNCRYEGGWMAKVAGLGPGFAPTGLLRIGLVFCPPNKRRFDIDNMLGRCKAALDGLADTLSLNDTGFREFTLRWGPLVKGGRVLITVEGITDEQANAAVREIQARVR